MEKFIQNPKGETWRKLDKKTQQALYKRCKIVSEYTSMFDLGIFLAILSSTGKGSDKLDYLRKKYKLDSTLTPVEMYIELVKTGILQPSPIEVNIFKKFEARNNDTSTQNIVVILNSKVKAGDRENIQKIINTDSPIYKLVQNWVSENFYKIAVLEATDENIYHFTNSMVNVSSSLFEFFENFSEKLNFPFAEKVVFFYHFNRLSDEKQEFAKVLFKACKMMRESGLRIKGVNLNLSYIKNLDLYTITDSLGEFEREFSLSYDLLRNWIVSDYLPKNSPGNLVFTNGKNIIKFFIDGEIVYSIEG